MSSSSKEDTLTRLKWPPHQGQVLNDRVSVGRFWRRARAFHEKELICVKSLK